MDNPTSAVPRCPPTGVSCVHETCWQSHHRWCCLPINMNKSLFPQFSSCVSGTINLLYTILSSRLSFCFSMWAAQVAMAAPHLDPMCYSTAIFIIYFFIHQIFFLYSVLSIFSSLSSHRDFSQFIPPSLLYGKTFLMLYSASVKPGAYFLCPKLIANVRRDPSPRHHLLPFWH